MKVEDVFKELPTEQFIDGRKYIEIDIGGSCYDEDDTDFEIPALKYIFMN
jgi:hypothetical protein